MGGRTGALAVAAVAALVLGSCGGDEADATTTTTRPATTTTAPPELVWSGAVAGEADVNGNYRQGLARSGDGWIFTTNNALYRTDAAFAELEAHLEAIPPELAILGYDHAGDPDIVDGTIWVPLERPAGKDEGEQVTARYDEETLAFVDSFPVAQHHNAWVAVDDDGTVWSADLFSDDTLVHYAVEDGAAVPLEPVVMSRPIERIQGGDVVDGVAYLTTDDVRNGVYRVDLATGEVTDLGSAGHPEGEGQGVDADGVPSGPLRVLVADEAGIPMWVVDVELASRPA